MKMQYTKPMLYAEKFALVEHIADCNPGSQMSGTVVNSTELFTCMFQSENGFTYFTSGSICNTDANIVEDENVQIAKQCYNGPTGEFVVVFPS